MPQQCKQYKHHSGKIGPRHVPEAVKQGIWPCFNHLHSRPPGPSSKNCRSLAALASAPAQRAVCPVPHTYLYSPPCPRNPFHSHSRSRAHVAHSYSSLPGTFLAGLDRFQRPLTHPSYRWLWNIWPNRKELLLRSLGVCWWTRIKANRVLDIGDHRVLRYLRWMETRW